MSKKIPLPFPLSWDNSESARQGTSEALYKIYKIHSFTWFTSFYRSFIDELLRLGANAVSAFLESLEQNRVEQFVFSTLADKLQSFRIEGRWQKWCSFKQNKTYI